MKTELYRAFELSAEQYCADSVPDMQNHVFSKKFKKKMQNLINRREPIIHGRMTAKKIYICITAAIIAASLAAFSVGAVRDFFRNFSMKIFEKYTAVKSADYESAPMSIKDVYTISVPAGFELTHEDELHDWSPFLYRTYYKNNEYIFFTQYLKSCYDVNVNTENRPLTYICINGSDGYIIDLGNNEYYISWDNGEYVFDVISNIGYNEQIRLAESVQKAE